MVSIDPTDPYDVPMYGGAHLGGGRNLTRGNDIECRDAASVTLP